MSDEFSFKVIIKEKPSTRRGILSIVSSVYDPLGTLKWDNPIEPEHQTRWNAWLTELPNTEQLHILRCFKPSSKEEIHSTQLHNFSDASQSGYGAVRCLRFEDSKGDIHCSFVMAKSRVAPVKATTIPQLELAAAVVAARLDQMVRSESEIRIDTSIFWTDSICVLGYLNNDSRRFQTFVANRIATIRETSSPSQWRYVTSEENPAADCFTGIVRRRFDT